MCPLRRQLPLRLAVDQLPDGVRSTVALPAVLVPRGGGAVLPDLARRPPAGLLGLAGAPALEIHRRGRARCPGRGLVCLLHMADPGQRAMGVLLPPDAGLGAGRRGPGRLAGAGDRPAARSPAPGLGRSRSGGLGRLRLQRLHTISGHGRARASPRGRRHHRRRVRPAHGPRSRAAAPDHADAGGRSRLLFVVPVALALPDPGALRGRPCPEPAGEPRCGRAQLPGRRGDLRHGRTSRPPLFLVECTPAAQPPPGRRAHAGRRGHVPAGSGLAPQPHRHGACSGGVGRAAAPRPGPSRSRPPRPRPICCWPAKRRRPSPSPDRWRARSV